MRVSKITLMLVVVVLMAMAGMTAHTTIKDITLQGKYNALLEETQSHECDTPVVEQVTEKNYIDTHIIANWCGGCGEDGIVRMVGAWWYGDAQVEDETGNVWNVDTEINPLDTVLLWIADNHTPEDVTDDVILKVWTEVAE